MTGGPNIGLGYDAVGHLISSYNYSQSAQTQYLYDGDELIAEYNSSGAVTARYVHGPGVDNPVVWYNSSWTSDRRWLVAGLGGGAFSLIAPEALFGETAVAHTREGLQVRPGLQRLSSGGIRISKLIDANPLDLDGFEFCEFTSPDPQAMATQFE